MKHSSKNTLQGTDEKGKISFSTLQKIASAFVIDAANKTIKYQGLIKRNARGSRVICNAANKTVKYQGLIKRNVSGSASYYEANMTAVYNREGDETTRAINTITNMSCNRAKVAEKYKGI